MSRLPVPGNDDGVWGDVLNDYLLQVHDATGQLKPGSVAASQLLDGSVTSAKLSSDVKASITRANTAVLSVNGALPDTDGNVVVVGAEGPQGEQGVQGAPGADGQDGASITVTLVSSADWPPPSDPDPLHWYVKVP